MPDALRLTPDDNVATMLTPREGGAALAELGVTLREAVARGHKVALAPMAAGAVVRKYGFPIGITTRAIAAGEWVHTHNMRTALDGTLDYQWHPSDPVALPGGEGPVFQGYARADGRVATRNEIWVLPTVGCVGRTAQRIAAAAAARYAGACEGVHAFTHPFGCSQLGDDLNGTRAILASLACHPNAAGVLLVGLGCESNQLDALVASLPAARRPFIRTLTAQAAEDETEAGLALIGDLIPHAQGARRDSFGFDRLVLGVKCGGSDGLSGLTANPLVGRMADQVAGAGGRVILTEIPEIFGAEQLLMDRAADRAVFDALVDRVNGFKRYFLTHGEPVSENPSPGNQAGGITTLEEKSLGAVQKAGRAPVGDVIDYGARVRRDGLTVLEAPGNDAVSSTALAAAGATMILFTTGRGTPLGFPVPTVKIASNHALAERKPGWIDFDAGIVLDQGFDGSAQVLAQKIAEIASGTLTAAERNGEREIAIWKRGVTL